MLKPAHRSDQTGILKLYSFAGIHSM
ncbi:hypothetical protein STPYR_10191 [uncultured Stenotrophomonas sp.]|uniref:Uncharacterized protein n=1 Tax=uncultured Stenotrophomonas sp. TaxID=165438 RepID=A0A1Y5PZ46_9GAMM|nr:hypothetical protein STPYR_10191 [uncultured Stenotrophomonas sp.]